MGTDNYTENAMHQCVRGAAATARDLQFLLVNGWRKICRRTKSHDLLNVSSRSPFGTSNKTPLLVITGYARVLVQSDLALVQHIVERWPTAARIEFGRRVKQLLATHYAHVCARLIVFIVAT